MIFRLDNFLNTFTYPGFSNPVNLLLSECGVWSVFVHNSKCLILVIFIDFVYVSFLGEDRSNIDA